VQKGVQVHVGEWGVFNKTPHATTLAWMEDSLSLWKEARWGFSLWNLRGQFGVLDSVREDVTYEDCKGHKLDRRMLELLKRY
jgi:endoglucanase